MRTWKSGSPTSAASRGVRDAGGPSVKPSLPAWKVWVLAARPRTLPAALVPVLVGTAIAFHEGHLAWLPALLALWGATWLQIGTNFANDYFDARKGADTTDRLGPTRVTQAGLASPRAVLVATGLAFGMAALGGAGLAWLSGWPVVVVGILSILSGIAYTGGPFPLGYNGLGDLFVFLFFGLVAVTGTVYVQAHAISPLAWTLAVPVGLLATAIIVVNNLRDAPTDVRAGKRTLAVRFGERFARIEYTALVAAALIVPYALTWMGKAPPMVSLSLLATPLALREIRSVWTDTGRALNRTLGATGQVLLVHGVLVALGLVISR